MPVIWLICAAIVFISSFPVNCANYVGRDPILANESHTPNEPRHRPLIKIQATCEETRLKGFYILKFHWPIISNHKDNKKFADAQMEDQDNEENTKPDGISIVISQTLAIVRLFPIGRKARELKKIKTRRSPFLIPTYLEQGMEKIHSYFW